MNINMPTQYESEGKMHEPFFVVESGFKTEPLLPGTYIEGRKMAEGGLDYRFVVVKSLNGTSSLVALCDLGGNYPSDEQAYLEQMRRIHTLLNTQNATPEILKYAAIFNYSRRASFLNVAHITLPQAVTVSSLAEIRRNKAITRPTLPQVFDAPDHILFLIAKGNMCLDSDFTAHVIKPLVHIELLPTEAENWLKPTQ